MKARLVIVDDVQALREEWRVILEEEFEIVGEAADGLQAVEVCCRACPDVIVMDLVMPRLSGIEATRQIIERCREKVPKIVIVSGLKNENIVMQAFEAGACDYLFKPVEPEKLRKVLRSFSRNAA